MIKALATIAAIAYAHKKGKEPKKEVAAIALGANVSASSCYSASTCVDRAALNFAGSREVITTGSNAWAAGNLNAGEWLGVGFGIPQKVTKVATQGRNA